MAEKQPAFFIPKGDYSVNVRLRASTQSPKVAYIQDLGEPGEYDWSIKGDDGFWWHHIYLMFGGELITGYVREDVIEARNANLVSLVEAVVPKEGLRLRWPTEFAGVTQRYKANKTYYSGFFVNGIRLKGHEGVDFVAPRGSKIFACADGVVKLVNSNGRLPNGSRHNYGIHIRLTHEIGDEVYETVYAHLLKPTEGLKVGDTVKRGTVIGYADSTGNSTGDHLHLTLKQKGASARKLTDQPGDIIDPTPFLDPFGVE